MQLFLGMEVFLRFNGLFKEELKLNQTLALGKRLTKSN
jgi:hypothetical protein